MPGVAASRSETVNFWLAAGFYAPVALLYETLAAIALVLLIAGAGRVFGLDVLLARRSPHSLFW